MDRDQTIARSLHDIGGAAWFGGALMGAVGLNAASAAVADPDRTNVADAGWVAWTPWKAAAIGTHVAGSLALLWGNKSRLASQHGAMTVNLLKTGVFAAAVGADWYASQLGRQVGEADPDELRSAVEPTQGTPDQVAEVQQRLRAVQWGVVALTGLNIVLGAKMGEQQRPLNVGRGIVGRLRRS